jgi:uncharacterized protein
MKRLFTVMAVALMLPAVALAGPNEDLLMAAEKGKTKRILEALENGADVNAADPRGWTPLMKAVTHNHSEAVNLLIERGANVNAREKILGLMPLMMSGTEGGADMVSLLLDSGAHVNAVDNNGSTALMIYCVAGRGDIIGLLVGRGADVNIKNKHGGTALKLATMTGNAGIVKLLKEAGARE